MEVWIVNRTNNAKTERVVRGQYDVEFTIGLKLSLGNTVLTSEMLAFKRTHEEVKMYTVTTRCTKNIQTQNSTRGFPGRPGSQPVDSMRQVQRAARLQ